MTKHLGSLLTSTDLPVAELCCARLDGEVVAVGAGWCPVDEPVGAAVRAQAAALLVPSRLIAERMTAAWIFGFAPEPLPHHFCVDHGRRVYLPPSPRIHLREVDCPAEDTMSLSGLDVTTPLRTTVDLARHGIADHRDTGRQRVAEPERELELTRVLAGLMSYGHLSVESVLRQLDRHPRAAHTALASERVRRAGAS